MTRKKVFVAMSGGVDSSVAAALLLKQGYDVIGAHMKCFNVDGCAERDAEDARRVAEQLGIPFYVFDFEKAYKQRVVDYMIKGYKSGITPNPDVMCNKEIKFGLFFEKARKLGADYVATGHYVRLGFSGKRLAFRDGGAPARLNAIRYTLYAARDRAKDQSYFLWTLRQSQLAHCLFPIGEYTKPQVRVLAKKFGLLTATKKDSQGICFLGQVSIRDFLKQYIKPKKGNILLLDSGSEAGMTNQRIIGAHDGAHLYTIGQRHGFGVGGLATPHYVVAKDVKKNTITIAPENHPALYCKEVTLTDVNFISKNYSLFTIHYSLSVLARVRYRQPLFSAVLTRTDADFTQTDAEKSSAKSALRPRSSASWKLIFQEGQKFVAEGQSAVFYSAEKRNLPAGRQVLGGGVIVV